MSSKSQTLVYPFVYPLEIAMTRYPRSGKGREWTVKELESIGTDWAGDSLSDGGGLVGSVRISKDGSASVRFKYAFRWAEKVTWYQCGTWPKVPLKEIRKARDEARSLVSQGVNPIDSKQAKKITNQAEVEAVIEKAKEDQLKNSDFNRMFRSWLKDGVARKDGNAELLRAFEKDVLPAIGPLPVKNLTEHELRAVLRAVVARGANRMCVRLYNDIVQLFAWAEKRQPWRALMIEGNPAELLEIEKIVAPSYDLTEIRERVLDASEIRELWQIFSTMEEDYAKAEDRRKASRPPKQETQLAMWICLSTMCRIGELLSSEWQHVDLEKATWLIPKENTKGTRGKKQNHKIFLSNFARQQFEALKSISGDSQWCFPARNAESGDTHLNLKSMSKQIGDRQMCFKDRKPLKNRKNDDSLVLARGTKGEWTPHDLRRTGSTMMQALGIDLNTIDRCQNHVLPGSKVRRHYQHHDYEEEKRRAWDLLGEKLESILTPELPVISPMS
ncbi:MULTISPECIES: tyrosine-type recombinase/integrase [unclassified Variovorax]|uniref:tyrosine-type recombinase/integrase n=1 Tax=unclassified Variovorax TaxID=663243 RepID=UPI0034E8A818